MKKRALLSVFDKTGIDTLATFLVSQNVEIISTGGTLKYLREKNIPATDIAQITHFKEMLDGRLKTLHPNIHGGILAVRANAEHMKAITDEGIGTIDFVVVNLYPFFKEVQTDKSFEAKVEFIDIGGPTMLRSAAKAFRDVLVICDPADYALVQTEISTQGEVSFETRKHLASKVFNLTSAYDAAICNFLSEEKYPQYLSLSYEKKMDLRYGENPHQSAAFYVATTESGAMRDFKQLHGKELSFNNIRDMDLAWKVVGEFDEIACCAVKHSTPCGVALADSVAQAYAKTFACDEVSIFGGIVAFNTEVDKPTAEQLSQTFLEIIIAPSFHTDALALLMQKKNLRLITCATMKTQDKKDYVKIDGAMLVQDTDAKLLDEIRVVTKARPLQEDERDMIFAMKIVKHVKSNAIVVASGTMALGIGAGQTNRIWATEQALERAGGRAKVLASDAFFPFRDCVEVAAKCGIRAIIQPGGSMRDEESIEACNEHGMAMVFTGVRHFKH